MTYRGGRSSSGPLGRDLDFKIPLVLGNVPACEILESQSA